MKQKNKMLPWLFALSPILIALFFMLLVAGAYRGNIGRDENIYQQGLRDWKNRTLFFAFYRHVSGVELGVINSTSNISVSYVNLQEVYPDMLIGELCRRGYAVRSDDGWAAPGVIAAGGAAGAAGTITSAFPDWRNYTVIIGRAENGTFIKPDFGCDDWGVENCACAN